MPTVGLVVTATNNSRLVPDNLNPQRDLILDLQTGLTVRAHSRRFMLDGDLVFDFVDYTRGTQTNRVLPRGRLDLNTTLIENNLFLDAGVEASRTRSDPFQPQVQSQASTANTLSTVVYRLSPYYSHEIVPNLSVLARSDNNLSRSFGDTTSNNLGVSSNDQLNDARTQYNLLRVERKPTPFGLTVEASRQDQRYTRLEGEVLRIDTVRAIGTFAFYSDLIGGLIGGHERSFYSLTEVSDTRYGASVHWRPDDRTRLDVEVEHRFFGTGWNINFQHRSPYAVLIVNSSRYPSATTLSLGTAQTGDALSSLLDSLLTTRLPNQADRATAVQNLIAGRGLSGETSQKFDVFSNQAQLNRRADVTLLFNGVRNTVTANAFYARAEALDRGQLFNVIGADTVQRGTSLEFNHRLTPVTSADLRASWSSIAGLSQSLGDKTIQRQADLSLNRSLSPRSVATVSVRRLHSNSVLSGTTNETAFLVGMKVRF